MIYSIFSRLSSYFRSNDERGFLERFTKILDIYLEKFYLLVKKGYIAIYEELRILPNIENSFYAPRYSSLYLTELGRLYWSRTLKFWYKYFHNNNILRLANNLQSIDPVTGDPDTYLMPYTIRNSTDAETLNTTKGYAKDSSKEIRIRSLGAHAQANILGFIFVDILRNLEKTGGNFAGFTNKELMELTQEKREEINNETTKENVKILQTVELVDTLYIYNTDQGTRETRGDFSDEFTNEFS